MYNNANNNMNPLLSLLGMMGGGQMSPESKPQPQSPSPSQGGAGAGAGAGGMDPSNPLIQLLTAMMGGQNAMNALQNILPAAAQYTQNNRGNQSMENFVRNEYNNRGVDINGAMEQLQQLMNAMNAGSGQNTYGGGYNPGTGSNNNNGNY